MTRQLILVGALFLFFGQLFVALITMFFIRDAAGAGTLVGLTIADYVHYTVSGESLASILVTDLNQMCYSR